MTIRNLNHMFKPRSVALILPRPGTSPRTGGSTIDEARLLIRNLLDGGFKGPIMPVVPEVEALEGVLAYPDLDHLPLVPELAVIDLPLEQTPELITELGKLGTRAAVLVSRRGGAPPKPQRKQLKQALLDAAKPYTLRIIGPGGLGLSIPGHGLNASPVSLRPGTGRVAFVTQSSGIARAALDWAVAHQQGFSHLISLGAAIDVDFGDVLDYLAGDHNTRAILLYIERIRDARKFMSAARRAARIKPVVVLKPRRGTRGSESDVVYEAAFRRAGLVRVRDLAELFNSAETLTTTCQVRGKRLAIVGNSRSFGLLATDALQILGGELAGFSADTEAVFSGLVDTMGYVCNPLDLGDHASPDQFEKAVATALRDPGADGLLVVNVPCATVDDRAIADAVKRGKGRSRRCLVAAWPASLSGASGRQHLLLAGIPAYQDPGEAVRAFMRQVSYRRNQQLLTETPASVPEDFSPDLNEARSIVQNILNTGRRQCNEFEAMRLLQAYAIPTVQSLLANTPRQAADLAKGRSDKLALKIISPDIRRKSDVGGVVLDLDSDQVGAEAEAMRARLKEFDPAARIEGFLLQPMAYREGSFELTLGVCPGGNFGPVIRFGHGGTESGVIDDIAWGLPPLNMNLAREIMLQTRIFPRLQAATARKADTDALALTLIKLSQMVIDLPEIVELDINPLWARPGGVLALDAKVTISVADSNRHHRLAIRPYPKDLEETVIGPEGREMLLRPILPEDETVLREEARKAPPEYMRMRFFQPLKELSHAMAAQLTQIDYDREMALVLTDRGRPGTGRFWGGVRAMADPDGERAEYSIIIHPDMAGLGVGAMLMNKIIHYARNRGIRELWGEVLRENRPMLRLNRKLGFKVRPIAEDPSIMHVSLDLTAHADEDE